MGSLSMNWRPDYSPALMRRELDIIRGDLHANAVRLGGRDPRRLLAAAGYAASIGLHVWLGPELWNATPRRTLSYLTATAAAAEPLSRRWPGRLTFSVGNELTLFMRGIVPGRTLAQRSRRPRLRQVVLSGQDTLRAFLAQAAASVRRVYSGPVSYSALPFERVDWDLFDVAGMNYYRQQARTTEEYLAKISRLQGTGKPVAITELGFAACRDGDDPKLLSTFNASPLSLLGMQLPVVRRLIRPRVRTTHPRDEPAQARLLVDQLQLLGQAGVDRAFVMSFSFPLAPYSEDPRHDLDATALSIVRTLPRGRPGTTYPGVGWEPKEAFHAMARYYGQQETVTHRHRQRPLAGWPGPSLQPAGEIVVRRSFVPVLERRDRCRVQYDQCFVDTAAECLGQHPGEHLTTRVAQAGQQDIHFVLAGHLSRLGRSHRIPHSSPGPIRADPALTLPACQDQRIDQGPVLRPLTICHVGHDACGPGLTPAR